MCALLNLGLSDGLVGSADTSFSALWTDSEETHVTMLENLALLLTSAVLLMLPSKARLKQNTCTQAV